MNGMNKAVVGAVFGIALIYSLLSLMLTVQGFLDTGVVTLMLFAPNGDALGIDLSEELPELLSPVMELYPNILDACRNDALRCGMTRNLTLLLIVVGFALSAQYGTNHP